MNRTRIISTSRILSAWCSAWLDSWTRYRHSVVASWTRHSAPSTGEEHASESHVSTLCRHFWTALYRTTLLKKNTRTNYTASGNYQSQSDGYRYFRHFTEQIEARHSTGRCVICVEQVASLSHVRANLASYPLWDGKWVVAYRLPGEGLTCLIGAVVCLYATPRIQLFSTAGNGRPHTALR